MHSFLALGALAAGAQAWQQGPPAQGFPFHGGFPGQGPPHWPISATSACASAAVSTVTLVSTSTVSPAATFSTVKSSSLSSSSSHSSSTSHSSSGSSSSSTSRTSSVNSTTTTHSITSAPATSTFSILTASTAASTASDLNDPLNPADHIVYSTVGGYFLQDVNGTSPSTFDYLGTNLGLINQTYPQDPSSGNLSQWQRFNRVVYDLNQLAPANTLYKLLFIGRHGEGWHNAAQTFYGNAGWNCFYSEIDGNSTAEWDDAHLTQNGINQALANNALWARLFQQQGIEAPQSYYVSPLTRCLQTANLTYNGLNLPSYYPFIPTIKELLREGVSVHSCDHRQAKSYIEEAFPTYQIESTFTENDELWNGVTAESSSAQDYRSKVVLDELFATDSSTIISITTHSGEGASLLRVLGHQAFSLSTGAIIPVLVKAQFVAGEALTTTTQPWQPNAWCTNGPPLSTMTNGACVCSNGVAPVATTAPASILFVNP